MQGPTPEDLVDALCRGLTPHEWLKAPWIERPDPLSRMWTAARGQAKANFEN